MPAGFRDLPARLRAAAAAIRDELAALWRSIRFRWLAGLIAGFWLVSIFTAPLALAQVTSLLAFFASLGVIAKYFASVRASIKADDRGPISQLGQGILLGFIGLALGLWWTTTARVVPGAEWMGKTHVPGFVLWLYTIAAGLHVTARRDRDGRVQKRDMRTLVVAYGAGLAVAIVLTLLQAGALLRGG